ncbi:MAG: hypothetical protein ACJ8A6_15620 [Gemmatimonadales bacterium]
MDVREARLKEEFAAEYPGIPAEVWIPVAELARKLVERHQSGRKAGRFTRTFDPTHFEFRGGASEPRARGVRTRTTDRKHPQRKKLEDSEGPQLES